MEEPNNKIVDDLDLLYKEYVRLSIRLDVIVDGSWNDFKLLGSIGVLIAWPPIAQSNLFSKTDTDLGFIIFLGFAGIMFIISVIGLRDLIKQSIMKHYLFELQFLEEDMRAKLHHDGLKSLHFAGHWLGQGTPVFQGIYTYFYLLFFLFLIFFPIGILVLKNAWPYAIAYGFESLVSVGLYLIASKLLENWQYKS